MRSCEVVIIHPDPLRPVSFPTKKRFAELRQQGLRSEVGWQALVHLGLLERRGCFGRLLECLEKESSGFNGSLGLKSASGWTSMVGVKWTSMVGRQWLDVRVLLGSKSANGWTLTCFWAKVSANGWVLSFRPLRENQRDAQPFVWAP